MNDHDRLAADLDATEAILRRRPYRTGELWFRDYADRLIALGWKWLPKETSLAYDTGFQDGLGEALDEERVAAARLLREINRTRYVNPDETEDEFVARMVPAIEAEAVNAALDALAVKVEGMDGLDALLWQDSALSGDEERLYVRRAAVLALIAEARR